MKVNSVEEIISKIPLKHRETTCTRSFLAGYAIALSEATADLVLLQQRIETLEKRCNHESK